jgi:hypothetical protein
LVTEHEHLPVSHVEWKGAVRIIRSAFPPIDLFGNLDLVPVDRRVGGNGSSYLMAPFTHISMDRPSRFTDGSFGVLYAGNAFETALFETIYHHARFMVRTAEAPGWTSQFREIILSVSADVHDLREAEPANPALDPDSYVASQGLAVALKANGANGVVYPSIRHPGGECVGLFYPDCASEPVQSRHLDYHWDGERVDLVRDAGTGAVFRVVDLP